MTTEGRPGDRAPSGLMRPWTFVAGGVAAWGALAAARELPWQSLTAVFLASGLLAASLTLSADAVSSDRVDLWRAARAGTLTGLVVVVAIGLAGTAGAAGVALVAVVLLTRPGLWPRVRGRVVALHLRRLRRLAAAEDPWGPEEPAAWSAGDPEPRDDAWERTVAGSLATEPEQPFLAALGAHVPLDPAPDWSTTLTVPTHLSDQDLCLAWESSSRALRTCTTTAARLDVVRIRQACLDELERRQPEAVRAWVLASADPDSSPARYLAG